MRRAMLALLLLCLHPVGGGRVAAAPAAAAATPVLPSSISSSDARVLQALRGAVINLPGSAPAHTGPGPPLCHYLPTDDPSPYMTGTLEVCPLRGWAVELTAEPCTWSGVACSDDGRVVELVLDLRKVWQMNQLGPPPLRDQASQYSPRDPPDPLHLSSSFLPLLAQLSALRVLMLSHAVLQGPAELPPAWGTLLQLRKLGIASVNLTGGLPPSWGQPGALPELQDLTLSDCGLGGGIPASWAAPGALPGLQSLDLSGNKLTGSLPLDWLAALPGLQKLNAADNSLTGPLPEGWTSVALTFLNFWNNSLTGTLPPSWARTLPSLSTLQASHNLIRGRIPKEWAAMAELRRLRLHHNLLSGGLPFLPGCWESLPKLQVLSLHWNHLTGALPTGCTMAPALSPRESSSTREVASTKVGGRTGNNNSTLCSTLGLQRAASSLAQLSLHHNILTGTLPEKLPCTLPWLRSLDVSDNRLTGTLPPTWLDKHGFSELWTLNLSGNALTGTVPARWLFGRVLTSLKGIDVSRNNLSGPVHLAPLPGMPTEEPGRLGLRDKHLTRLYVRPGNDHLCTAAPSTHALPLDKRPIIVCLRFSNSEDLTSAKSSDEPCTQAGASPPPCSAVGSNVAGIAGWGRAPLLGAGLATISISAVAAVALHYSGSRRRQGQGHPLGPQQAGQGAHADQPSDEDAEAEGVQLLAVKRDSSSGPHLRLPGSHAELEQHLLSLLAKQEQQRQPQLLLAQPTLGDLQAALLSGPLQLQLSDIAFCRAATKSGGSASSGACNSTCAVAGGSRFGNASSSTLNGSSTNGDNSSSRSGGGASSRGMDSSRASSMTSGSSGGLVELGTGGHGKVYLALLHGTLPVAVKVMLSPGGALNTMRLRRKQEVELMHRLRHPGILQLLGVCEAGDLLLLVTELMRGGSLYSQLGRPEMRFHSRGRSLLLQVASALLHLHRMRTVHLDVKSSNVLVDEALTTAKVCDVGMAGVLARGTNRLTAHGGTLLYSPPEQLLGGRCGPPADVFGLGTVILEVVMGTPLRVRGRRRPSVPEDCPQHIADLIVACLRDQPAQRPSLEEVVAALAQEEEGGGPRGAPNLTLTQGDAPQGGGGNTEWQAVWPAQDHGQAPVPLVPAHTTPALSLPPNE